MLYPHSKTKKSELIYFPENPMTDNDPISVVSLSPSLDDSVVEFELPWETVKVVSCSSQSEFFFYFFLRLIF